MRAWRIYPHTAAYAREAGFDPLDGAGGRVAAGRWNEPGYPIVYAADSASLAALETLANLATSDRFGERTILEIDVPGEPESVALEHALRLREDAPPDDPEELTRAFGTQWLKERRTLALVVPSFVMPYDRNVLINPLHEQAQALTVLRSDKLRLDGRLLR